MGFPVGYSEMPKLVLHLLFLLGHLRRVASWLLRLTGAEVDSVADVWPDADHHQCYYHDPCGSERGLEEHSPAVRFDALSDGGAGDPLPEGCAVCLGDFHGAAEVRRPRGCRHVFHRSCLDRWAEHGQRTCPMCRTPLFPPPPAAASPLLLPLPLPAS